MQSKLLYRLRSALLGLALIAAPVFAETLTIIVNGQGSVASSPIPGIACPGDCSEIYATNTAVSLVPTPTAGYIFSGWTGDADCSDVLRSNLGLTGTWSVLAGNDESLATNSGIGWGRVQWRVGQDVNSAAEGSVDEQINDIIAEGVNVIVQLFHQDETNMLYSNACIGGTQALTNCDGAGAAACTAGLGVCGDGPLSAAAAQALLETAGNGSTCYRYNSAATFDTAMSTALTAINAGVQYFSLCNEIDRDFDVPFDGTGAQYDTLYARSRTDILAARPNAKTAVVEFASGLLQCASGAAGGCGQITQQAAIDWLAARLTQTHDWVALHVYGCIDDIQKQFAAVDAATANNRFFVLETGSSDPRCVTVGHLNDAAFLNAHTVTWMPYWLLAMDGARPKPEVVSWLHSVDAATSQLTFDHFGAMFNVALGDKVQKPVWEAANNFRRTISRVTLSVNRNCTATFAPGSYLNDPAGDYDWDWGQ